MSSPKLSRRELIKLASAASVLALSGRHVQAAPSQPHPRTFQSGDFLWPARPGAFIPRYALRSLQPSAEQVAWEEEKRAFIEKARASGNPDEIAAADQMEALTYKDFQALYFNDTRGSAPQSGARTRGFSPLPAALPEVGHVAIIEVDRSGTPWVVEAMPKAQNRYESLYSRFSNGVIRTRYSDWATQHKDYNVWHGRLRDVNRSDRRGIAAAAGDFLGKDYWFWSFNLSDESAFYCSKLVWVSVFRAIDLALDEDKNFVRRFWVTPKQLASSKFVEMLHSPGVYGEQ